MVFGLSCFAYDTGGTDYYVVNGVYGYMLPLSSDWQAVCRPCHSEYQKSGNEPPK
jgi:hypothetical protein